MNRRFRLSSTPRKFNRAVILIPISLVSLFGCGLLTWIIVSGTWNTLVTAATAFLSQEPSVMLAQALAALLSLGILYYCVLPILAIVIIVAVVFWVWHRM